MPERKGRAVPCRGTSACDEPLTQEQDEVCHAGVVAQLQQERADLLPGEDSYSAMNAAPEVTTKSSSVTGAFATNAVP